MPLREYKCPECGRTVEVLMRMDEKRPVLCLDQYGHSVKMKRVEFSVPAKRNPRHGEG